MTTPDSSRPEGTQEGSESEEVLGERGAAPGELSGAVAFQDLSEAFRASARRWEMVVYPSLVAFLILAIYGFYLVYNLAQDAHIIAGKMEEISVNMEVVSKRMDVVSKRMSDVSGDFDTVAKRMQQMSGDMERVAADIRTQSVAIGKMNTQLEKMNKSIHQMNGQVRQIQYHFGYLNRNVSQPMGNMGSFMP